MKFHFLNVLDGDCSIIEHNSGRNTVIDVCNAETLTQASNFAEERLMKAAKDERGIYGNFNQKAYPVNPIKYMKDHDIESVFRFVLTHPDMDHMDGIESFFTAYPPQNFWDTDNEAQKNFDEISGRYSESDWLFYKNLRDSKPTSGPKRLALLSGACGSYWNSGESRDGLHILAPTDELMAQANGCGDYNDSSYVLLYRTADKRILFGGDSDDDTWAHVLRAHSSDVKDIDLLIAPHHGRDSGRSYEFLDHLNPKMTFFGNARSQHLAYDAWNSRGLEYITNNQANCMVVQTDGDDLDLYVSNETFAKAKNARSFYAATLDAWFVKTIS